MTNGKLHRYHHIDGLRGLAIIIIIMAHFFIPRFVLQPLQKLGFSSMALFFQTLTGSGVEVFCLISGLVLLGPLVTGQKSFKLNKFFYRRLQRLWPPYLVALLLAGGEIWLFTVSPNWLSNSLIELPPFRFVEWLAQIFILNWGNPAYNGAWWFLSIEIVFYGMVPILIFIFNKIYFSKKHIFALLIIAIIMAEIAFQLNSSQLISNPLGKLVLLFFSYFFCYISGAFIKNINPSYYSGCFFVIFGCLLLVIYSLYPKINFHNANALFWLGVLILSFQVGSRLHKFLTAYLLVWVGERSYSLFLIHLTTLTFGAYLAAQLFAENSAIYYPVSRCLALLLTFAIAMLLFTWAERPFAHGLTTSQDFWPARRRS